MNESFIKNFLFANRKPQLDMTMLTYFYNSISIFFGVVIYSTVNCF